MSEVKVIGKWKIPSKLYDDYVKFRILADAYLMKTPKVTNDGRMSDYEIRMRWKTCVQRVMELHREICKAIGVEYSTDSSDNFYGAFIEQTTKDAKLKG